MSSRVRMTVLVVSECVMTFAVLYLVFPKFREGVQGLARRAPYAADDVRRRVRRMTEEEWVREMRKVRGLD